MAGQDVTTRLKQAEQQAVEVGDILRTSGDSGFLKKRKAEKTAREMVERTTKASKDGMVALLLRAKELNEQILKVL